MTPRDPYCLAVLTRPTPNHTAADHLYIFIVCEVYTIALLPPTSSSTGANGLMHLKFLLHSALFACLASAKTLRGNR